MAIVEIDENEYEFVPTRKHTEIRWISESEIEEFKEESVNDFPKTLDAVFRKAKELSI